MPSEAYKPLGLIAISITWVVIGFLLYKFRGNKGMSISKHAAAHKNAFIMMAIVETAVLPMFLLFVWKWFAPTFNLPDFFVACVAISASGLLLAAWIPDVKGRRSVIHGLAAYGAAMIFVPATTILYVSPSISALAKGFVLMVLIYQLASVTAFTAVERSKEYHLYIQALYIFLFHAAILFTAYVR